MTTTITLHVNGRYRAIVKQDGAPEPVEVHGNYEGSPNPEGKHTFNLVHGSKGNKFVVSEYYIPTDEEKQAEALEADKRAQSAKLEVKAGKAVGTDADGKDTKTGEPVDVEAHLKSADKPKSDDLKVDFEDKPAKKK